MRNFLLLALLLFSTPIWAQFEWTELTQEAGTRRFDDVFFLTNQKGWAVNSSIDFRKVFYTSDGGSSWQVLRGWTGTQMPYVRSIQFFNDSVGLMGTLGGGMYRSTNGGQRWDSIQAAMSPRPVAICGMYRVNDSVLYAVGDYASSARMYKTRDRGLTWTFIDVGNTASNLIDVYFTDEQNGFAIGRAANPDSGAVIIYTANGGNSWSVKAQSGRGGDLGWKLFFLPDGQTGFATVQARNVPIHYFFKTTDGGQSWQKKTIQLGGDSVWFIQGMMFTPAGVGYAGGHFSGGFIRSFDMGESWNLVFSQAKGFNRFWKKPDNTYLVGGSQLYRLDPLNIPIPAALPKVNATTMHPMKLFPNPVVSRATVEIKFAYATLFNLYAIDELGRKYRAVANGFQEKGDARFELETNGWSPGLYYLILETDQHSESVKMIVK